MTELQLRLQRDIQRLCDKMYKSLIEMDGWVSVDERLPENDSEVGCITADGEVYIDRYVRGTMYGDIWRKTEKKPVKWLPLKPKKGGVL